MTQRKKIKQAAIELRFCGYDAKASYKNNHVVVDAPQDELNKIMDMLSYRIRNIKLVSA